MKNILRFVFAVSLSLAAAIPLQAQWIGVDVLSYSQGFVDCFAFSGNDMFAGTGHGVFLSTDDGASWTGVSNGIGTRWINALLAYGGNLFAGTAGGLYVSWNDGANWRAAHSGLDSDYVTALGSVGTDIFVATYPDGIFRSTDNGSTWTEANDGLPGNMVINCFVAVGKKLFAGTSRGLYVLADSGSSWSATDVASGQPDERVLALATNGTEVFAVVAYDGVDQVYRSTDYGVHWSAISNGLALTNQISALAIFDGSVLLAGTQEGVILYGGGGWTMEDTGLRANSWVLAFGVHGSDIYAGTNGKGVFLSTDGLGQRWKGVNSGLISPPPSALAYSGTDLFIGNSLGVLRATNSGGNWTAVKTALTNVYVTSLAISGTHLFAGTKDGVFLSTDNGASWTPVSTGLPDTNITVLTVSNADLFAGTDNGVFVSTDNGGSWAPSSTGLTNTDITAFAVSNAGLLAGTKGDVFLSTNEGDNWASISDGLEDTDITAIAVSDTGIFVGTDGGVFLSTNLGRSWNPADSGLADTSISPGFAADTNITALFAVDTNLFAGAGNGMYRSSNNGRSWSFNNMIGGHVYSLTGYDTVLVAGLSTGVYFLDIPQLYIHTPVTIVNTPRNSAPGSFLLDQNYPNPFNPTTMISYQLPMNSQVTLKVYDVLGREVATLVNGRESEGEHSVTFNASGLPSGVYFYRLEAGSYLETKKLVLLK